ncbi:hypothetical protein CBR_g31468 [Chara braunii]|uniref:Reverse transcriptase domain-containing protein n=1 Tax=Chara braunii TaxID=69332 RepID=A0A388LFE0_CHABU|nr:hypothetical protein CBR_g31468 [Chara braunii]|eukprot:GBG80912.1 hypothetical protein CBR_g31468 [Chara braunii]
MVETRAGKSTSPYTQEQQEKMAALVRENKERKKFLKQAKLKAITEEQAAKMKELEEEMEKKKKDVEEETVAEAEEERKRREVKGESSGTANEDAAMEKKISEWIANLSLGEDEEAEFYVPQDERDALASELAAMEDPQGRRERKEEKKLEWKLRMKREKKRRRDEVHRLTEKVAKMRDCRQEVQADFARDMVTHVGGEVRRLRDSTGKFCEGAIEGAKAIALVEGEARPRKEPFKLKLTDAYGGKKEENFDNWEASVNSYVYLQHILTEEQVLVAFQGLKDEAPSFARSLARAASCENNMVAYSKIITLPQFFKVLRERFADPTRGVRASDKLQTIHSRQWRSARALKGIVDDLVVVPDHGVTEPQLVQLFYRAMPEPLRGHFFEKSQQADITYDVLSREVVLYESKSMPVSTFWHKDLDKGKKWKGRTISGQVRAKDHMILTLEEGGRDEIPYSEIEWGLEEDDSSIGQGRSYAVVAAGGRPQGRGGGQRQKGQAMGGRGPGAQGVGGQGNRQVGAAMDQKSGETTATYQTRMLAWSTEAKQWADAVAAAEKKKAEDAEQARLLAIKQQRQHDEAAAKAADEEQTQRREKMFNGERAFLTMAADWRGEVENGKMEESESKIALLLSHITDLLALCIAQQEDIHNLDAAVHTHKQAIDQVNNCLQQLQQRPSPMPAPPTPPIASMHRRLTSEPSRTTCCHATTGAADLYCRHQPEFGTMRYGVVAADLYTEISWGDLKAAWHKRFQVESPEIKAMDTLMIFEQGTLSSVDWIVEYQHLTSVPDIEMGFKAVKHYFITRLCPALGNALTHVEDTLTTTAELFDKAAQIIVTNKEAKNLNRSSAPGPHKDQHRPKVDVVAAATPTDQSSEAVSANEGDRLAAARDGGRPAAITNEFHAMLDRFVLVYLDDILVYSRTLEDHFENLRRVFETLRRTKYKANRDKCKFVRQELEYLGHFVTPEGISPLSDKIQAIQEWSEPRNVTDAHSFLGLAGYYQRFVTGYSKIAAHLTKLQCEDRPFDFGEDARGSFLALKVALLSAEVLPIYDPLLPTCVTTDASGYGIGVVLEQHDGVD